MNVLRRLLKGPISWRQMVELVLVTVTAAAGALVYTGFFATIEYLPIVGLACVAAAVVATVVATRRWKGWATTLVAVVGFALYATYTTLGDTIQIGLPSTRTASELFAGVANGWTRMLTVQPPADAWGGLLITPVLLEWSAAFAAVTLAMRTRSLFAPIAPPLLAFIVALLIVGKQESEHTAATLVFLVAAALVVLMRANQPAANQTTADQTAAKQHGHPQRIRSFITVGLTIAAIALIGTVGGQAVPLAGSQSRFDPRDLRPPPITLADTLTPLAYLRTQLVADPPRPLFTVRLGREDAARIRTVRTVALDEFDGTTWTTTDTFRAAGSRLAGDPGLTNARSIPARIEVKDLAGPFLPTIGWPAQIAGARQAEGSVGYNAQSGVLVSTARTLRGLGYDFVGKISSPGPPSTPSTSAELAAYRRLPAGIPSTLMVTARRLAGNQPSPYAQLTSIEQYFRSRPVSLTALPGHSYAAIARILEGTGDNTKGYAEQFASAFTVFARALGYPARVAVGYRLHDYRDGAYVVSTADAHAWSEVHFADYGWVSFDPTNPSLNTSERPPSPPEIPLVAPPRPSQAPAAPLAIDRQPAGVGGNGGFDWGGTLRGTLFLVVDVLVLLLLAAAVSTATKARRRRRRHNTGDPAARVLGAWCEITDRLTERGVSVPVSLTAHEVAELAQSALGTTASPVSAAASLATTAVFSPEQLDEHDVERAWRLAADLNTALYPRKASIRRLRATVDPRPLWTNWLAARDRRRASDRLEMGRYR